MTQMMRYQIDGIHERGEPLAALFATESAIYGRFGYGVGSVHEQWSIEKGHNTYARRHESPGRIEFIAPKDIGKELPDVMRRSTQGRPAVFQRAPHHWERDAQDPIHSQGGSGGVFYAAYVEDGRIDGYVNYRTQPSHRNCERADGRDSRGQRGAVAVLLRPRPLRTHRGHQAPGGRPNALDAGRPAPPATVNP